MHASVYCVCVYVYMYVCVYVYMYVWLYVWLYVCMSVCMYIYIYMCVCVCVCVCAFVCWERSEGRDYTARTRKLGLFHEYTPYHWPRSGRYTEG